MTTEQLISLLSNYTDGFLSNNMGILKSFIFAEMREMAFNSKGKLTNSSINKRSVNRINQQVQNVNNYNFLELQDLVKEFKLLIQTNADMFKELGYDVNLSAMQDIESVRTVQRWAMSELGGKSQLMTDKIKSTFHKSIYGNQSTNKLIESIGGKWDNNANSYKGGYLASYKSHAFSIANTGLAIADRKISTAMSEQMGIEWYKPTGPKGEKIIRPFCYAVMNYKNPNSNGKIPYSQNAKNFRAWYVGLKELENVDGYIHYTVIKKLKNEQKGMSDTLNTFGGWNCRHQYTPARFSINRKLIAEFPELHSEFKDVMYSVSA